VVPVETAGTSAPDPMPPIPDASTQPALYILPFDTLGDTGLDNLARALRIRTGSILTRIPLLRIVSVFPEADRVSDPRELRARFGITHVLEVRLQRSATALTADASLTETQAGLQVWAQQDETMTGAGEQEILLHKMIRRIEPRLMQAMATHWQTDRGEPSASALLMQAIVLLALKGWRRTTFVEATGMIEQAIVLDPDLALSHAYLALLIALGHRVGLLQEDSTTVPGVVAAVDRALELENQDSTILGLVGCALADIGQVDRAFPILQKAIDSNPQNGHAKTALGAAFLVKRDYATAVEYLSDGIACSPADSRSAVWGTALAMAHLGLGESGEALRAAQVACQEDDRLYLPRLSLAAVHLVREDQVSALAAVRECIRTKPDLDPREINAIVGKDLGAGIWAIAETLTKHEDPGGNERVIPAP